MASSPNDKAESRESENFALYLQLRDLRGKQRDKLIDSFVSSNIPLAVKIAKLAARRTRKRHIADDLKSSACKALVIAVKTLANRELALPDSASLQKYLVASIRREVAIEIKSESRQSLDDCSPQGSDKWYYCSKRSTSGFVDIIDHLQNSCHTARESKIVYLRSLGLTDIEIAKKLKVGRMSVGRDRKRIERRFVECHESISA